MAHNYFRHTKSYFARAFISNVESGQTDNKSGQVVYGYKYISPDLCSALLNEVYLLNQEGKTEFILHFYLQTGNWHEASF